VEDGCKTGSKQGRKEADEVSSRPLSGRAPPLSRFYLRQRQHPHPNKHTSPPTPPFRSSLVDIGPFPLGSNMSMSLSVDASPGGSGAGSSLPPALLWTSLACTLFSTLVSTWSIYLHLKGYRRPALQRLVVRIMVMYVGSVDARERASSS
jgi:hypothetical protein